MTSQFRPAEMRDAMDYWQEAYVLASIRSLHRDYQVPLECILALIKRVQGMSANELVKLLA